MPADVELRHEEPGFLQSLERLCSSLRHQADATEALLGATTRLGAALPTDAGTVSGRGASQSGTEAPEPELGEETTAAEIEAALGVQTVRFSEARIAENRVRFARQQLQALTGLSRLDVENLRMYVRQHLAGSVAEAEASDFLARLEKELERLRIVTEKLVDATADVTSRLNVGLEQIGGQTRQMTQGRRAAYAYAGPTAQVAGGSAFFIDRRE